MYLINQFDAMNNLKFWCKYFLWKFRFGANCTGIQSTSFLKFLGNMLKTQNLFYDVIFHDNQYNEHITQQWKRARLLHLIVVWATLLIAHIYLNPKRIRDPRFNNPNAEVNGLRRVKYSVIISSHRAIFINKHLQY